MKPSTRISTLLALTASAVAVSPAGASAQAVPPPLAPYVTAPITTTSDLAQVSIGNGAIAWSVREPPFDSENRASATTVWTLRDGKPVIAARIPKLSAWRLEAGTDAAGNPAAIVSGFPGDASPRPFYLVRLDTGEVRRLRLKPQARLVNDVALDAGRILYLTSDRARSSLWTARLDGNALIERTRLRNSRRGETFETVRADRRRIAVTGDQRLPTKPNNIDAYLPLYAGTARGMWRRISHGSESEGGVYSVEAAGFSRDRRSVIVTTTGPDSAGRVERVSLRTGRARTITPENSNPLEYVEFNAAHDPSTERLLLSSSFSSGYQLGWSNVLRGAGS